MKRLLILLVLTLGAAFAQGHITPPEPKGHGEVSTAPSESKTAQESAREENEQYTGWKWANFAILVLVLAWLGSKSLPAFFRSRSEVIERDIAEATRLRQEAEARAARIEVRMASLDREVQHIRQEAQSEMSKERERILKDTDQHLARLRAHAEQDIEALAKHATQELRSQAAELAVGLAEQRIRSKMTDRQESEMVSRFTRQLERQRAGREAGRS